MAYTPRGTASGGPVAGRGPGLVRGPRPSAAERADRVPALTAGGPPRVSVMRRRRELPYWVSGVVLVVAGALAAVLLVSRSSARVEVLALARDVPVGQPLSAADLRTEQILAGTGVPVVAAGQAEAMVGRVAAVPLRAGRLLAADDVGPAAWPPAGQLLVAVAVGPGAAPPELAAGMHVLVGTGTPDSSAVSGTAALTRNGLVAAPEGVVAGVRDNPAGTGGRVVSLLLTREGAGQVTAIPASQLRLVILPTPAPPAGPSGAGQPGGGG
jgi:hypothetical protein